MVKAGIIGITGYTGEEILNILSKHSKVEICGVYGRTSSEERDLKNIYPQFENLNLKIDKLDVEKISKNCDIAFLALPHTVSFEIVPALISAGVKIIDLSADFRIKNSEIYENWYNAKHTAKELIGEAVYGLPELNRKKIASAKLIANPGCYPTSIILGCIPAVKNNLIDCKDIIIDSVSGISGAGREAAKKYFDMEHPNFRAYKIAGTHRHIPEIEQELSNLFSQKIIVSFTPHIIPMERGMMSTIYLNLKENVSTPEIIKIYRNFYTEEQFIKVLDDGNLPNIKNVVNTNFCEIGLKIDNRTNRLIIISAIDNLIKGASGQAVQNMNIMFGFNESEGLNLIDGRKNFN
jgi:N-acetyl-gamma-glutamyl-phosphate reductase